MTATMASSSSSEGTVADSRARPLGVGFVGAGMVGHLADFALIPGCRPVALAELRPQPAGSRRSGMALPGFTPITAPYWPIRRWRRW